MNVGAAVIATHLDGDGDCACDSDSDSDGDGDGDCVVRGAGSRRSRT
ncbi:hypothetical protein OG349_06050 [Streptomyces sp. NBC_01317]|nr:hypothetical protein OG349_06050 [Streptomyces sp. NBC_01317]